MLTANRSTWYRLKSHPEPAVSSSAGISARDSRSSSRVVSTTLMPLDMSDWAIALFATLLNIVILIFGRHRITRGRIPSSSKTPDRGFSNEGEGLQIGEFNCFLVVIIILGVRRGR